VADIWPIKARYGCTSAHLADIVADIWPQASRPAAPQHHFTGSSVIQTAAPPSRAWTLFGLAIALFALPLLTTGFRLIGGPIQNEGVYLARELLLFLTFGALLWIVRRGERLPLGSLGWSTASIGRSLLWGLIGAVLCAVGLVACMGIISISGMHFGGDGKSAFTPPAWAMLITVLRAGVIEETFYRGYAIERLQRLTGSAPLAFALPLVVFAAAHYRQGSGGILIALVMGAILAIMFLKRRDLLAVMTAHFIVDFVPNILLPMLSD